MTALTFALLAATLGGFLFDSTRRIGLIALAVLVLLHPIALLGFVALVVVAVIRLIKSR